MPEVAEKLYAELRRKFADRRSTSSRPSASATRAWTRSGTPYCFTIDGDTLKDQTVTVRDRDTASQERIAIDKVVGRSSRERIGA